MTFVDVDNIHGALLVMEHLIALGHKKIAYISKPTLQSSQDRLVGYRTAIEKYNLPYHEEWVLTARTSSVQSGFDCTYELLQKSEKPTAIFLANDMMAIGAINAIIKLGLQVPKDISVVGFDDVPLASYITPSLTTVRQPTFEKGVRAADALINSLETSERQSSVILGLELVIRASTAPVN